MQDLLQVTIDQESAIAARDAEIAIVQKKHQRQIEKNGERIATLNTQIEGFYRLNRAVLELDGKNSVQLACGLVGLRAPTNPALVPLSEKWSWERIEKRLRRLYKARFFHAPKPPGLDKVKIKRELDGDHLAEAGLALSVEENFFIELNRLAKSVAIVEAAA